MPLLLNLRLVDGLKLKAGNKPTFRIGYSAKYRYEWFYTDAALGKYVFLCWMQTRQCFMKVRRS